jgi:hypothetical protein
MTDYEVRSPQREIMQKLIVEGPLWIASLSRRLDRDYKNTNHDVHSLLERKFIFSHSKERIRGRDCDLFWLSQRGCRVAIAHKICTPKEIMAGARYYLEEIETIDLEEFAKYAEENPTDDLVKYLPLLENEAADKFRTLLYGNADKYFENNHKLRKQNDSLLGENERLKEALGRANNQKLRKQIYSLLGENERLKEALGRAKHIIRLHTEK